MLSYIYELATDRRKGFVSAAVKFILYLFSLIYGLIIRALIFIYRLKPERLNCRVISVGNITLGGTGKTSLVLLIAQYLRDKGRKVAVLSRGYKRKGAGYSGGEGSYENMGDEPYMLMMKLESIPVIVDSDRTRAAALAIRDYGADTVILDDGMQQWRIKKDLEIVTIDAVSPFGNRHLIPRGILREPLFSLARADIFVLTKTDLSPDTGRIRDFLASINGQAQIIESIHKPVNFFRIDKPDEPINLEGLRGLAAALFSGIGEPDSFENLIKSLGIRPELSLRFRDHHSYTQEDLDKIIKDSRDKGIYTIITTEKDAIRIRNLKFAVQGLQLLYLRIELEITKDEQEFYNRLLGLYPH